MQQEVRYEKILCDDAEYLLVAYGSSARVCQKSLQLAREKGIKVGLFRPITLYPFPYQAISEIADRIKGILSVELNTGQMIEDIRLAVSDRVKVEHYGRMGGVIHSHGEVLQTLEKIYLT